ncbi:hypothetical protein [Sutcliffiella rhizosphaerae]|uniref:NADH dehydrogenase subunit 6 n=1 Tax=Sutcliffiella rhizosphaerae TaxID=2880967 RepID=A0ABM8YJC6_9BACI|nr:hypothetical protein [Sutcliffiella rhizosphaerae]CAG9620041.1 hypothetical protein BACCIP111883_00809 [Sutcliffiella rhizosphaerae]
MENNSYEKEHLKKLITFSYVTLASSFSLLLLFISIVILSFPMIGILDFTYFPSKIAITSFILAIIFSVLAIRTLLGKILLVSNLLLMLFMVFYGP